MFPTILSVMLMALLGRDDPPTNDVKTLLDTIESLQRPVEDFRCEFEGSIRVMGKVAEDMKGKVGEHGLYETFSGIFIWKRGGDTHSNSLHRMAADGTIARETLAVRVREHQAEQDYRLNDAQLGRAVIKSPKEVNSWLPNCLGYIFLIDKIKRDISDEWLEPSISEDLVEGRPLKVLNIALKKVPDSLIFRYWIDLRRNGHVVRFESYANGKTMNSRLDIELAPFKVGGIEVWMPVSGKSMGYAALVDKKPIVTKEPTSLQTINVVDGTMEFNKRPSPAVFTLKYKTGRPISDRLRKLTTEFGQQKIGLNPTKAEEQKAELVVVPVSRSFDWSSARIWALAAITLLSMGVLLTQRWRR